MLEMFNSLLVGIWCDSWVIYHCPDAGGSIAPQRFLCLALALHLFVALRKFSNSSSINEVLINGVGL